MNRVGKIVQRSGLGASAGKSKNKMTISIPEDGSVSIKRASNGGFIVDRWENNPKSYKSDQYVFTSRSDFELE